MKIMNHEHDYVNHFYKKFEGRVAIGVGYNQDLSEIHPFVFEDTVGNSIGVVALGVYLHEGFNYVHIYHIGSFKGNQGNGAQILQELCLQADKYQITLSLSPIPMPNGKKESMNSGCLKKWYGNFGFKGRSHFIRQPAKIRKLVSLIDEFLNIVPTFSYFFFRPFTLDNSGDTFSNRVN